MYFKLSASTFVRLSAFDNDKRIDKVGGRLLPGSFATTDADLQKRRIVNMTQ